MLMTVAELRAHVDVAIEDAPLLGLLTAAEEAITERIGPLGAVTEILEGGTTYLMLKRRAASITSVTQLYGVTATPLNPLDWQVSPDGRTLRRLTTGPNYAAGWAGRNTVIYTPVDDLATRKAVQLKLVQLDIESSPAYAMLIVGSYTRQFRQDKGYSELREDVLAALSPGWVFA